VLGFWWFWLCDGLGLIRGSLFFYSFFRCFGLTLVAVALQGGATAQTTRHDGAPGGVSKRLTKKMKSESRW
jgi:hypothetical protein